MLATGSEPRGKLEIARWTGLEYRLTSESQGSFGLSGQPPTKTPTSHLSSVFQVVRGTADPVEREIEGRPLRLVEERATLERIEVKSPTMDPVALGQLNAAFGLLRGLTTRSLIAEDGEVAEVKTESVAGVKPPPEIKKIIDDALDAQRHFPLRLPPVPVGVGARWRFSEPLEVRGVKAVQVAEMTLLALGEKTARIAIKSRHQAPKQNVPHPTEPGLTASLEGLRGDSAGEITIDRLTACILSARLTATSYLTLAWSDASGEARSATFMEAQVQRLSGEIVESDAGTANADALDASSGDGNPE